MFKIDDKIIALKNVKKNFYDINKKLEKILKQKKIISLVFLTLIGTLITFAQTNEIYNKIQIEPISKSPIKDSKLSFGEIFNEAKALLYFSDFWVEGRIGLKFYSLEDLRYQAKLYLKRSNNIPMAILGYKTPNEYRKMLEENKKINSIILN